MLLRWIQSVQVQINSQVTSQLSKKTTHRQLCKNRVHIVCIKYIVEYLPIENKYNNTKSGAMCKYRVFIKV